MEMTMSLEVIYFITQIGVGIAVIVSIMAPSEENLL
jgi:hypothetical protein